MSSSSYRKQSNELRRSASSASGLTTLRKMLFHKSKTVKESNYNKVEIIRSLSDLKQPENKEESDDGGFCEVKRVKKCPSVSLEDVRQWQRTMGEFKQPSLNHVNVAHLCGKTLASLTARQYWLILKSASFLFAAHESLLSSIGVKDTVNVASLVGAAASPLQQQQRELQRHQQQQQRKDPLLRGKHPYVRQYIDIFEHAQPPSHLAVKEAMDDFTVESFDAEGGVNVDLLPRSKSVCDLAYANLLAHAANAPNEETQSEAPPLKEDKATLTSLNRRNRTILGSFPLFYKLGQQHRTSGGANAPLLRREAPSAHSHDGFDDDEGDEGDAGDDEGDARR